MELGCDLNKQINQLPKCSFCTISWGNFAREKKKEANKRVMHKKRRPRHTAINISDHGIEIPIFNIIDLEIYPLSAFREDLQNWKCVNWFTFKMSNDANDEIQIFLCKRSKNFFSSTAKLVKLCCETRENFMTAGDLMMVKSCWSAIKGRWQRKMQKN